MVSFVSCSLGNLQVVNMKTTARSVPEHSVIEHNNLISHNVAGQGGFSYPSSSHLIDLQGPSICSPDIWPFTHWLNNCSNYSQVGPTRIFGFKYILRCCTSQLQGLQCQQTVSQLSSTVTRTWGNQLKKAEGLSWLTVSDVLPMVCWLHCVWTVVRHNLMCEAHGSAATL